MKKNIFLAVAAVALLAACNQVEVINPDLNEIEGWDEYVQTGNLGVSGVAHNLVLVRFKDEESKNYVAVAHRMLQKECGETIPVIYEKDTLGLSCSYFRNQLSNTFPSDSIALFAEDMLSLCGSSPYRELADGYYLIDWRWYGIARPFGLYPEDVPEHCFLSNTRWKDLSSLSATWRHRDVSGNPFAEIAVLRLQYVDLYCGFNHPGSYWFTHNASPVYAYYLNYDLDDIYFSPEMLNFTYDDYVQFSDSMYSVYQDRLTEAIKKGDLHKFAQRHVYE